MDTKYSGRTNQDLMEIWFKYENRINVKPTQTIYVLYYKYFVFIFTFCKYAYRVWVCFITNLIEDLLNYERP